jgi:flagellin-like protein
MTDDRSVRHWIDADDRAVSPVIGVILMVAVTVILAAVIGAFLLEIGDQGETAPKTSFDVEERVVTLQSDRAKNVGFAGITQTMEINTSQIVVTHTGGDTLPVAQTELKVEGYRDAWGVIPHANALAMSDGEVADSVEVAPQPDFRKMAGTNERVELSSGGSWNVVAFNVHKDVGAGHEKSLYEPGTRDVQPPAAKTNDRFIFLNQFDGSAYQCSCPVLYFYANSQTPPGGWGNSYGWGQQLERGQTARVVWTAASGGESQTLTKYTSQHAPTGDDAYN